MVSQVACGQVRVEHWVERPPARMWPWVGVGLLLVPGALPRCSRQAPVLDPCSCQSELVGARLALLGRHHRGWLSCGIIGRPPDFQTNLKGMEGIGTYPIFTKDQGDICIEPESFESQPRSSIGYPLQVQPAFEISEDSSGSRQTKRRPQDGKVEDAVPAIIGLMTRSLDLE